MTIPIYAVPPLIGTLAFLSLGLAVLGLYITKQLAERNGGKIGFETSAKGTTFILEFKLTL